MAEIVNPGLPDVFIVRVGACKKAYLSARDRAEYEAGYRAHRQKLERGNSGPMRYVGPWWEGFDASQRDHREEREARNEQARAALLRAPGGIA